MISGSPPTERKARTGELTPPTRTCSASANISRERRLLRREDVWVTLIFCLCSLHRAYQLWSGADSAFQPSSGVFRMVRQNDIGAGALYAGENFEHDAFFIEPAILRGRFDHRVL